jgi:hypothetical protein
VLLICPAAGVGMGGRYSVQTPRVHTANVGLAVLSVALLLATLRLWWLPRPPMSPATRTALSILGVIAAIWCAAAATFWALFVG